MKTNTTKKKGPSLHASVAAAAAPPTSAFDIPAAPILIPPGPWTILEGDGGGVCAAKGFLANGMAGGLRASGPKADLALVAVDPSLPPAAAAGERWVMDGKVFGKGASAQWLQNAVTTSAAIRQPHGARLAHRADHSADGDNWPIWSSAKYYWFGCVWDCCWSCYWRTRLGNNWFSSWVGNGCRQFECPARYDGA